MAAMYIVATLLLARYILQLPPTMQLQFFNVFYYRPFGKHDSVFGFETFKSNCNLPVKYTRCGRKVMRLISYLPKFVIFFKDQCYPLQNISLGHSQFW